MQALAMKVLNVRVESGLTTCFGTTYPLKDDIKSLGSPHNRWKWDAKAQTWSTEHAISTEVLRPLMAAASQKGILINLEGDAGAAADAAAAAAADGEAGRPVGLEEWTADYVDSHTRRGLKGYCWEWLDEGTCHGCSFRHKSVPVRCLLLAASNPLLRRMDPQVPAVLH